MRRGQGQDEGHGKEVTLSTALKPNTPGAVKRARLFLPAMPNTPTHVERPYLGFGLGLRPAHYETILNESPAVDWFEIISENYLVPGGKPIHYLERIRARYPLVMHGVSLSIGSHDPLDREYLRQLKALADRIEPAWLSDHLCWTGVGGANLHDLLPLPYTEEALRHVVERVQRCAIAAEPGRGRIAIRRDRQTSRADDGTRRRA